MNSFHNDFPNDVPLRRLISEFGEAVSKDGADVLLKFVESPDDLDEITLKRVFLCRPRFFEWCLEERQKWLDENDPDERLTD